MSSYRAISSDSHIVEPPDLWTSRAEPKWRDRVPRIVREENSDVWYCDGQKLLSVASFGTQVGVRFEEPEKLTHKDTFENVRKGGFIPEEHVKDMDLDGVSGGILYPSMGLFFYTLEDSKLLDAIFRTYNDWLAEFCNSYPERLKGIAMINVDDVGVAVSEIERCANMGLAGAMVPSYLPWAESYALPKYEPFWAAAQDLRMPISLHAATNRPARGQPEKFGDPRDPRPAHRVNRDHWVRDVLADIIFDGLFERYPNLRVGAVENELSWAPHFLDRMDFTYRNQDFDQQWHRFKGDAIPSDYFHQNVFMSFQEDAMGIRDRQIIGVDNLMWGSDYPHIVSTFPRSRQILEEVLKDCTDEEKAKIAGENVAKLYNIDEFH